LGRNGKPILLDAKGSVIQTLASRGINTIQRQKATAQISTMIVATKFVVDGIAIFTDPSLAVIDVEQGEAGLPLPSLRTSAATSR
jgi:hypothetical protein